MRSVIRQKVINFIFELHSQSSLPLWSLAKDTRLYTIAIDKIPVWGPRQKYIFYTMQLAYRLKISDAIIFLTGLCKIIHMSFLTKKNIRNHRLNRSVPNKFIRIFAGFGTASEEYLYNRYKLESDDLPLRINWETQEGISELCKINLFKVVFILAHNAFGYTKKVKKSFEKISSNATYFLTGCALNIGQYAYYHYFFQIAKKKGIQEIAFSVPEMAAFSAVDVKIRTIFLQHGLLGLGILLPNFDRIDVLTFEEECYLKRLYKHSQIVRNYKRCENDLKNNVVMILSPSYHSHVLETESLITWLVKKGFQVVIRTKPKVLHNVIDLLKQKIPNFILDDFSIPLEHSFENWRPKIVASWTSTGLATALLMDSIPVSFYDPINGDRDWELLNPNALDNMIYPMRNRVLFWPYDKEKIEMAVQSVNNYRNQILHLKSYQDF